MEDRGNVGGELDTTVFTEGQVKGILKKLGIKISGSTEHDFVVFCPFHGNRNTPSMTVSKHSGVFLCFNQACNRRGSMMDLISSVSGKNYYQSLRMIISSRSESLDITKEIEAALQPDFEFSEYDSGVMSMLRSAFPGSPGEAYMLGRGFDTPTLEYFEMGYSARQSMVTLPVHSPTGMPVGFIGRSVIGKEFKNSVNLPRNHTLFNLHNARRYGSSVIVTESGFDAMRVHQAGYPNVVATMGSHIAQGHIKLFQRTFDRVIVMVDNDNPKQSRDGKSAGMAMRTEFIDKLLGIDLWFAMYDTVHLYPPGVKDATDMTVEQVDRCIRNAVPSYEFVLYDWTVQWNVV